MDEQVNVIEDAEASDGAHEKKTEMELGTPKPKTILPRWNFNGDGRS